VFTHFSTSNGLVTNIVNGITQDDKGYIWLASIDGLQRYDGNNFLTFRSEGPNAKTLPVDNVVQVLADFFAAAIASRARADQTRASRPAAIN